jgi:serine phosphatase RsbU (regulator of sigma subunit)
MPRGRKALSEYAEGSAEYEEEQAKRELARQERKDNPPTERNLTITVSVEAVQAAKSLAVLSDTTYRQVLALAATNGVEALTERVKAALLHREPVA